MGQTMCYGYHIWSKELVMQAKNDDDIHRGQRSLVLWSACFFHIDMSV